MSGDHAEPLLATTEITAGEIENTKDTKILAKPAITVTANGLEIQSRLNPFALEFFPSYLRNKAQIIFNEKSRLKENITPEMNKNSKQSFIITESDKKEDELPNYILETPKPSNIKEIPGIQGVSQNVKTCLEEEHESNQLQVLIANEVRDGDSKIVRTTSPVGDMENLLPEKKEKEEKHRQGDIDIPNLNENSTLAHENHNTNKDTDNITRNVENCTTLTVNVNGANNNADHKNKNISNEAAITKEQYRISGEVKEPKKKLSNNSKIARALIPAIESVKQVSSSKSAKNEEPKQEVKLKAAATIAQNSKLTKNLATKRNTCSKYSSSIPNKTYVQPFKTQAIKSLNKDSISNRSTSSTEKSLSSTKSYPQNCCLMSAEKPLRNEPKKREYIIKSPRATVSSKLRQTETQKRRNLFFDLDSIKMSEFLFK